mgnify:CR=1 FL=1
MASLQIAEKEASRIHWQLVQISLCFGKLLNINMPDIIKIIYHYIKTESPLRQQENIFANCCLQFNAFDDTD